MIGVAASTRKEATYCVITKNSPIFGFTPDQSEQVGGMMQRLYQTHRRIMPRQITV